MELKKRKKERRNEKKTKEKAIPKKKDSNYFNKKHQVKGLGHSHKGWDGERKKKVTDVTIVTKPIKLLSNKITKSIKETKNSHSSKFKEISEKVIDENIDMIKNIGQLGHRKKTKPLKFKKDEDGEQVKFMSCPFCDEWIDVSDVFTKFIFDGSYYCKNDHGVVFGGLEK